MNSLKAFAAKAVEIFLVGVIRLVFAGLRALGVDRASNFGGFLGRKIAPLASAHKTALRNLALVYPEKSEAERLNIALGAWENLGRTAAEYAVLDQIFDYDHEHPEKQTRCEVVGIEHFMALKDDGKAGILFSAHLGNWELPAICAAKYGLEATAVYRAPNDPAFRRVIGEIRGNSMGGLAAAGAGAAFAMAKVLEEGGHLGQLIDQHFTRGVRAEFMGQPAMTNPAMAKFARNFECPVHGVRVIRLPKGRFRLELTPALTLPRDEKGDIDVEGSVKLMTSIVESWVREYPEQWLWMHRRWRAQPPTKA